MREALESYAAAQAAERMTQPTLLRLQYFCDVMEHTGVELAATGSTTLDEASLRRFLAADMAFHMLIIEAAGNRRMIEVVKNMRTISRIFRMRRAWHDLGIVQKAHTFHRLILEALRNRDPEAARRQMAAHIVASKEETLSLMNQTPQDTESMVLSELPSDVLKELDAIEQFSQLAAAESSERR
jgi:DNA-binding FadR family transcriptional regulator